MFLQSISPGTVKTDIFQSEDIELLSELKLLRPEDVAGALLYALGTPPHVQVNRFYFYEYYKRHNTLFLIYRFMK